MYMYTITCSMVNAKRVVLCCPESHEEERMMFFISRHGPRSPDDQAVAGAAARRELIAKLLPIMIDSSLLVGEELPGCRCGE